MTKSSSITGWKVSAVCVAAVWLIACGSGGENEDTSSGTAGSASGTGVGGGAFGGNGGSANSGAGGPGGGQSSGGGGGEGGEDPLPDTSDIYDEVKDDALYVALDGDDGNDCTTIDDPCKTIQAAVDRAGPGQGVVIREGMYREAITITEGGAPGEWLTIVSYPGEKVVVSGADLTNAGDWEAVQTSTGTIYRHDYDVSLYEHPSFASPQDQMRPELVAVDGVPMLTVYRMNHLEDNLLEDFAAVVFTSGEIDASKGKEPDMATLLGPALAEVEERGALYVDGPSDSTNKSVWVRFPHEMAPSSFDTIEIGTRGHNLKSAGTSVTDVRIVGLYFTHAANTAKQGALKVEGNRWFLRDVTVEQSNGVGISLKDHEHELLRTRALDHGQMGFYSVNHDDSVYREVEASRNNWKNYDARWEAGGGKWTVSKNLEFYDYYAEDNNGIGLWLDIANYDAIIDRAIVVRNRFMGIHIEHNSDRTLIKNCVIFGTKFHHNYKNGSDVGCGIRFSHASENTIENCTIYSNEGWGIINRYDDSRGPSLDNTIRNNLVLNNGLSPSQVSGETFIQTKSANDLDEATYEGNVWGAPVAGSNDDVFKAGYGFGDSYTGDSLQSWLGKTGATGDERLDSNAGVLEDLQSPTGYAVVDGSLGGVGAQIP